MYIIKSLIAAAIDILMDVGAQVGSMTCIDKKMSVAVRLKERVVAFLGLALISAIFVSCRSLNYIVHLCVTANSF